MEITLRKAHTIIPQLTSLIYGASSVISEPKSPKPLLQSLSRQEILERMEQVSQDIYENVENHLKAADILFNIRSRIAYRNAEAEESINSLVLEKNRIETKMKLLSLWCKPASKQDEDVVDNYILSQELIGKTDRPYRQQNPLITTINKDTHNKLHGLLIQLKREQARIVDRLAYINNKKTISLTEDEVNFLNDVGIFLD